MKLIKWKNLNSEIRNEQSIEVKNKAHIKRKLLSHIGTN